MPAYTWATGETITAAKLNTLETEAWRSGNQIASGTVTTGVTTASTAFVNTGVSVTFTAKTTSVYILFSPGEWGINNTSYVAILGVNINSTDYSIARTRVQGPVSSSTSGAGGSAGIFVTGLTAGNSYTASGRIATSNATTNASVNVYSSTRQTITVFEISK